MYFLYTKLRHFRGRDPGEWYGVRCLEGRGPGGWNLLVHCAHHMSGNGVLAGEEGTTGVGHETANGGLWWCRCSSVYVVAGLAGFGVRYRMAPASSELGAILYSKFSGEFFSTWLAPRPIEDPLNKATSMVENTLPGAAVQH